MARVNMGRFAKVAVALAVIAGLAIPARAQPASDQQTGSANANSYGFNVANVLARWQSVQGVPGQGGAVNPVKLGVDAMTRSLQGNGALPTDSMVDREKAIRAIHKHVGAYTDEEVGAPNQTIDPEGELAPSARVVARLDAAVKYWLNQGDPIKAQKVAQRLVLYGNMMSQQYGEAAVKAIQAGKFEPAVKYIQQAYDQVPDGQSLNATVAPDGSIHASIAGPDGKTHDLGAFGPQQVFKLALGLPNGTEYMHRIETIANGGNAPARR